MKDIKRDSGLNTNTKIYFEVRATGLHPRIHTKGFSLSTIESSIKGLPPRNYKYNPGVLNSTLSKHNHLYTRRKAQSQAQSKEEKITTW